jgi:RNA polymerase sigma-70 factor, ECF subfamily
LQQPQSISDARILQLLSSEATFDQGFRLLMQTYREGLYWKIRRMVQVHADADDVLQNTFIKVYKGIGSFEGKSKLGTWLYRIAMNEAITFCQSRTRKQTDSLDASAFQLATLVDSGETDGQLITQLLAEAVDGLPEKQRVVFNMRYFDETPYEEMSQILDTSVGALKASFHHAVKKIERFITDQEL